MKRVLAALTVGLTVAGALSAGPAAANPDYEDGQIVVSLQPGGAIEDINNRWGTSTLDAYPEGNLYLLDALGLGDTEALAEQMAADPDVLEAEANYYQETAEGVRQMVVVIVGGEYVDYEDQEIGPRIGLDEAHLINRGSGITVAVLDTGIDPAHEAFAGRLSSLGYDFVSDDAEPWEEANDADDDLDGSVDEGFGHGTMVAGIVALVAPEATVLPIRVLGDEGNGDAYRIAKGVQHAIHHGADVLNMSFGIPRGISILEHQLAIARSQGIVIVAGAGNENLEEPYYPAANEDAEMVTAVDSLDLKASFADWHSRVLVSAPGTGVRSAYPGGQWAMGNGCSFATPFVTGEAALIRSQHPELAPEEVRLRLRTAVVPVDSLPENEPYRERLGSGRIYIPDALDSPSGLSDTGRPGSESQVIRIVAAPNPSRGGVHFLSTVALSGREAQVFDASGRVVRVLEASDHPSWDGLDGSSRRVSAGIYYVRFRDLPGIEPVRVGILR